MNKKINEAQQGSKSKSPIHSRSLSVKQMADVIESTVGAVALTCGINTAQNFLKDLRVLEIDQEQLYSKLRELKFMKEENVLTKRLAQISYG